MKTVIINYRESATIVGERRKKYKDIVPYLVLYGVYRRYSTSVLYVLYVLFHYIQYVHMHPYREITVSRGRGGYIAAERTVHINDIAMSLRLKIKSRRMRVSTSSSSGPLLRCIMILPNNRPLLKAVETPGRDMRPIRESPSLGEEMRHEPHFPVRAGRLCICIFHVAVGSFTSYVAQHKPR